MSYTLSEGARAAAGELLRKLLQAFVSHGVLWCVGKECGEAQKLVLLEEQLASVEARVHVVWVDV